VEDLNKPQDLDPYDLSFELAFFRRRLKPSMTRMKRSGERGNPYLRPLPLWKKGEGSQFINTTNVALVMQLMI